MEGAKCSERSEAARMLDREQRAPGSVTRNEAARKGECACGIKMPVSPGPSPQGKEAGSKANLLGFAMCAMHPATRAELLQFHARRIVALVFAAGIIALLALGARQRNDNAIRFLRHCLLPQQIKRKT